MGLTCLSLAHETRASSRNIDVFGSIVIVSLKIFSLNQRLNSLLDNLRLRQEKADLIDDICQQLIMFLSLSSLHYSDNDRIYNVLSLKSNIFFSLVIFRLVFFRRILFLMSDGWCQNNFNVRVLEWNSHLKLLSWLELRLFMFFINDCLLWVA